MAKPDNQWKDNLQKTDKEELDKIYKENGLSGFQKKAHELADQWRKTKIHIAFIGQSGSGKSSLINAMLGLKASHPRAAKTGATETTKKVHFYEHPRHDNIFLVDLPGCGTKEFLLDSYFEKIDFGKYDFFIFVNSSRFLEDDIKLAKKLRSAGSKFYFVRTKIGQDVENFKQSYDTDDPEEIAKCITEIRKYCFQEIGTVEWVDLYKPPQFVVDSYIPNKYDFELLVTRMVEDAPEKKRESFVLGLDGLHMMGETLIKEKGKYLKRRIWITALLSAAGSAVPVPGVGEAVDIGLLQKESKFFCQQLGLDEETLKNIYRLLAVKFEGSEIQRLKTKIVIWSKIAILDFLASSATSNTAENIAKYSVPILGLLVSASLSYGSTVWGMRKMLNRMVESALDINRMLRESSL